MASVSALSSADFRASLTQQQNPVPEGEEPFSLLLNSVADVKASAQRPEAPRAAERRNDVPAKQPKPEADDRQAKRQTKDATKPDAKPQTESSAAAKSNPSEDENEETAVDGDDTAPAEAILAAALSETQEAVTPATAGGAEIVTETDAAPVIADPESSSQTPVPAAAAADAADAAAAPTQQTPSAQTVPAQKPQSAAPTLPQVAADSEAALPKPAAENISTSAAKPADTALPLKGEAQVQPGPINISGATALRGPAQLEMLNAAISKHVQLSLGFDANNAVPDTQKPIISSNAVAPNFAMTAQINAPVQVQTQQATETARTIPVAELAVEIATRAGKGERRFEIRLDPPELGRIDVRLEIDSKGNTTTKLIVERSETLDMLQRDARGLEKALQNAGLKTDAGGLQFSLQQDTQAQQGHQSSTPEMRGRPDLVQAESEGMTEVSINSASLAAQLRGGVDIRI